MKKLCIIAGTRPNLIKVSALVAASKQYGLVVDLVDTYQHYDTNMRNVFYSELNLPVAKKDVPKDAECIIVIGDTNSTVVGALLACEKGVPLAHVEAGCRCWDKTLPEEVNRIMVDSLSDFLFCPTETARSNVEDGIFVGDVLYDMFKKYAPARDPQDFTLITIHRQANTKDHAVVKGIVRDAALRRDVLFPVHPRTRKLLNGWTPPANVHLMEPVSYVELLKLLSRANEVITDSGGVQREAYWMGVPCKLERTSTSWPECEFPGNKDAFGDGRAAYKIMEILADA